MKGNKMKHINPIAAMLGFLVAKARDNHQKLDIAMSGNKAIVYGKDKTGKELFNILKETFVLANVYELTIKSQKVSLWDTFEHLTKNTLFIHGNHLEIIK